MTEVQANSTLSPSDDPSADQAENRPVAGAKILVVDDQSDIRSLLEDMLAGQGYEVHLSEGVEDATREMGQHDFDAVLIDIYLGDDQSGLDLLPVVKRAQPFTPAIVVTGMASTDSVLRALKAGAYDLLTKPFTIAEVLNAVANAVEKKTLAAENARLMDALRNERDLLEVRVEQATHALAHKVQTLKGLNEQLSTIFEMSRASAIEAPLQGILQHIIGLLSKILDFDGVFCVVFDLRAKQLNLQYADSEKVKPLCQALSRVIIEHHESLNALMENPGSKHGDTDLKQTLLRLCPEDWDSRHGMIMPLYAPQTLLGVFGVIDIRAPTNLSESEERILAFAISHFLAAIEQRNYLNRTTQLVSLGELVSEIAHDLRHPMTSLRGAARILEEKWDQQDKRTLCLDHITTGLTRMESLVSELVNFYNPKDMNMVVVDLHALADKALEVSQFLIGKKNIQTVRRFEAEPAEVLGLSHNLIEAFVNIISNAIQWMEPGGILTISTRSDLNEEDRRNLRATGNRPEEYLGITFEDTGCGMTPGEMNKIFKRFYTTRPEGHGLGLSAVNRIVRKNLGSIHVQSEPGRGSAFTIYLPKA